MTTKPHGTAKTAPSLNRVSAEVIACPGRLSDDSYPALQLNVEGFDSPYVLTLSLSAVGYKALTEQSDPTALYEALASAVNNAKLHVQVSRDEHGTPVRGFAELQVG
jgi:hypothetical protein